MKTKAILALGSNLGDRESLLHKAIESVALAGLEVLNVSPIVESSALTVHGIDTSKPTYLNCVIEIATELGPQQLLLVTQGIELSLGRERDERWGDRNIDIDIITFGEIELNTADLVIPHPEALKRSFVIVPWALMNPDAELPGVGRIEQLAKDYEGEVSIL